MKSAYSPTAKLDMLTTSAKFVIPESADGGYPESRNTNLNWIPDLDFVSSGMTFGADFYNF